MENKDKSEQLLDLLLDLTDSAVSGLADGPATAYQLAGEVVHELEEAKARIAEMEQQAAIGRRAAEMLGDLEWSGGAGGWPACPCCGWEIGPNGHAEGCKLFAILRGYSRLNEGVSDG